MPLLHRQPFVPNPFPKGAKDLDEVFYCGITGEVFRDYEEYCNRIVLCNSLVWSCSLTGRPNLTYEEAAASEEKVKKLLKSFPMELRIPVLYLASLCERRSLLELAEEVFSYVKDRYFIGETVQVSLPSGNVSCHVLSVIPPTTEELGALSNKVVQNRDERHYPPAVSYKYEVVRHDNNEELVVPAGDIFRKKSSYSKDKNRLYIKQFVHLDSGFWKLKESSNVKYGINKVRFHQIFCGEPPDMNHQKKPPKPARQEKGGKKQEPITKFFPKAERKPGTSGTTTVKKSPRKTSVAAGKLKQRRRAGKKDAVPRPNRSRRASNTRLNRTKYNEFVKEWNMKREDLECEDLKEMPVPTPVESKIPNESFGDVALIVEFINNFRHIMKVKHFFPHGFGFELMERCLTAKEVAGPLCDLLQLLLTTIFDLLEQESAEIRETDIKLNPSMNLARGDPQTQRVVSLATRAERWIRSYHCQHLSALTLDTSTISEILRLHLLSSGANPHNSKVARWRYLGRGGYCNYDDPAIALKIDHPHLIDNLAVMNVGDFDIHDKLKIISCLVNQILTYSVVRDDIEEYCEKARQVRIGLRAARAENTRKEKEAALKQKEAKKEKSLNKSTEELGTRSSKAKDELSNLENDLSNAVSRAQLTPIGQDRAFRRYWVFPSIPGLFVEDNEQNTGPCLPKPTPVANINEDDNLLYVRRLFEESGNKENIAGRQQNILPNSPKKLLGEKNSVSPSVVRRSRTKSEPSESTLTLLCTADPHCPVHSGTSNRPKWSYFGTEEELNKLIESLNNRGIRERKLKQALVNSRATVVESIAQCPFVIQEHRGRSSYVSKLMKPYDNAMLGFDESTPLDEVTESTLRDLIMETEEKITEGTLGSLKVRDRRAWRVALSDFTYDKQCKKLVWGYRYFCQSEEDDEEKLKDQPMEVEVKKEVDFESRSSTPSLEDDTEPLNKLVESAVPQKQVVADLASAILQIEQSVDRKYLKRPLGLDKKEKVKGELSLYTPAMERWEKALMESTSFSQLFLHLSTLENSVLWERSALYAFCRICRRRNNPEHMLLCDTCNKGHHLYCLKPKLTKVPPGDWHCRSCKPFEQPSYVVKKRRLFCEESDEEMEEDEEAICIACNEAGPQLTCENCEARLHLTCVSPPVRKVPKSKWFCHDCRVQNSTTTVKQENGTSDMEMAESSANGLTQVEEIKVFKVPEVRERSERQKREPRRYERNGNDDDYIEVWGSSERLSPDTDRLSRRKSSKAATAKISQFAKQLRSSHWDENGTVDEAEAQPNSRSKRARRFMESPKKARYLPLDNAALQEILDTLMHHKDAWPFLRPVTKSEVPDYHLIIKKPMDFATIKHKLNMLEYTKNSELIADTELLFDNCCTYNQEGSEVYKAGETLHKLFYDLCREYNLQVNGSGEPAAKKSRTVF